MPARRQFLQQLVAGAYLARTTWSHSAEPDGEAPVSGRADERLAPFDRLFTKFLKDQKAPGAALGIVAGGKLVYARGYGWADLPAQLPMGPAARFRLASVSKPFTAVALLRLVQQKLVELDAKIWDILQPEPFLATGATFDDRWKQVTVRHCLQHTGGWDRAKSFDPMFRPLDIAQTLAAEPPAGPAEIVRYMAGRPLDTVPGEAYAYSNFGYCLLGRVLEKMTGRNYMAVIQAEVCEPLGLKTIDQGRTLDSGRAENEVRYHVEPPKTAKGVVAGVFDKDVPVQYGGWNLEAMDAHGGLIGSASDVARLAAALDNDEFLTPASRAELIARPAGAAWNDAKGKPKPSYYGLGWMVLPGEQDRFTAWHMGALDGTSTLIYHRRGGPCWAVLFNAGMNAAGKRLAAEIDPELHKAAAEVQEWPTEEIAPE